jgi:hypothetical protein
MDEWRPRFASRSRVPVRRTGDDDAGFSFCFYVPVRSGRINDYAVLLIINQTSAGSQELWVMLALPWIGEGIFLFGHRETRTKWP